MHLRCLFLLAFLAFSQQVFAGGDRDYHMPEYIQPERIDIVRDSFGVPHIFAPTDAEVAYGLAWATMEDDSKTAQYILNASKGLMGRMEGINGAAIDYAVYLTRVRDVAQTYLDHDCPEDFKRVVEGYCAGTNAYFALHWDELSNRRSFPITPTDLISGYMLGMGLMAGVDKNLRSIVEGTIQERLPTLPGGPSPIGSNVFAMNDKITADGGTYLDINSHQPLEGILSWYEAHLSSEEGWNITGSLFHGGLSIFHGATENLAWAHTVGEFDRADVYALKMVEGEKNKYMIGDEVYELEKDVAKLRVGLGKKNRMILPVRKKIYWSKFGPTIKTKSGVFALRMPALMEPRVAEQWWRMNKTTNFEEFKEVLDMQAMAMMNVGYADKEGNIYLLANGKFPKRKEGLDWTNPVWGIEKDRIWKEYYDREDLAWFENPDCGYVFNVNNSAYDGTCKEDNYKPDDFSPTMGYTTTINNRSARFYELMEQYHKVSWEDFLDIKFDHTYPGDTMYFLRDFEIMSMERLSDEKYPDLVDAFEHIRNWDRTADSMDTDLPVLLYALYEVYNRSEGDKEKELAEDPVAREEFFVDCIRLAKNHMIKTFGTMEVPLGRVHGLERGGKWVPVNGGPDMIRASAANKMEDGRLRIWIGDSFIQLVRFDKDGTQHIWSVSPFGASNKPESEHYNDQMELYSDQKFKKMSLDRQYWYDRAKSVYHPK